MNAGVIEFLTYGVLLIAAGALVIIGLVKELAPAERARWFLGVGLGTGVLAFTLKIGFVVIFAAFSVPLLDILPEPRKSLIRELPGISDIQLFESKKIIPDLSRWSPLPTFAPAPADNPQTAEKIALGKKLFFDARLSLDGTLSCASCHEVSENKGGADGRAVSTGIYDQKGTRNAPTVLNAAFQRVLFWDGRAASLEEQALGPLTNPIEMGMPDLATVEARIRGITGYAEQFAAVFPENPEITRQNVAKAIAAYERTLITPNSPYDRFVAGDRTALTEQQIRGMALFESTGCTHCHSGPNFSEASVFGETAVFRFFPAIPHPEYEQKYRLTEDRGLENGNPEADRGVWRVPSLRNVARTAPYFHNGSVDSLEEAVRIMASVQLGKVVSESDTDDKAVFWSSSRRAFNIADNRALSDSEVGEIVAFLGALSGELPEE